MNKNSNINKNFEISFKMPTDEESARNTLSSWRAVEPTLLSRINRNILKLSMKTLFVPVEREKIEHSWLEGFDGKGDAPNQLISLASMALKTFPNGFFFKLDSRSPKEFGNIHYTENNIDDIVPNFFSSMRVIDDLVAHRWHREIFFFCFREWVNMTDEHRIFIKDGSLQGITRYDYQNDVKPVKASDEYFAIAGDYLDKILPYMPINTFVFDIGFKDDGEPILIEVNPYGLSDPCCFKSYDNIKGYIG